MRLLKKHFDVLSNLLEQVCSQRRLQALTGLSLGTVNRVMNDLSQAGYVKNGLATPAAFAIMERYRVKRAVFLAAGFGSRLVPVTLNTPKPLVRVFGERIIDSLLDACLAVGIDDIWIVRGYLGDQFDTLLKKYPMVRFLDNPVYNETNNISSALAAKDLLSNAYVFEADILLHNPAVLKKYHYCSDILGYFTERTDDWCLAEKNGFVAGETLGGTNCYQMVGISYWSGEDGRRLANDLEAVYHMPGGKERYWEQVPLVYRKENYNVLLQKCRPSDATEIDTFGELKAIDKAYCV